MKEKKVHKQRLYVVLRFLLGWLVSLIFRLHVHGRENEPEQGPYIVCSNHISFLDTILNGIAFKKPMRFMAKAELFKVPIVGALVKGLGAYGIKRGASDVGALKTTINILKDGGIVCMYPQGTRCAHVDVSTTKPRTGVAMLAYRAGVGVVPVFVKTKSNSIRPFQRTDIYIGEAIKNEDLNFVNGSRTEYENATNMIFSKIIDLSETSKTK